MDVKSLILRTTYWINDWFHASPVRKQYIDIKRIQENYSEGQIIRKKHLHDILSHAVQNSAFYKKYNSDDFLSFPVVNKNILRENYDSILVDKSKIPYQKGEVHIQHTSGSTGTPFHIHQDTRKRIRRIAELKYFGQVVGFKSHDPLVHLRIWTNWQNKSRWQSFKENIIAFNMANLGDERIKELCNIIKKKKISCLRGYASSFANIARYVGEHDIKLPSLKVIIAGSEALQEDVRDLVKKYIKCNIISQYANEENGILAQESISSDASGFYLNHASYYFEILKMDSDAPAEYGELGRIVLTDFFNYAFPIIRYDTGDLAIMEKGNILSCGYPYFSKLYGRRLDLIYNTKGEPMSAMTLSRILKYYPSILQWQFIQKNKNTYNLKIVLKDGTQLNQNEIANLLKESFGQDANITFEYVRDIPVLSSGKRKPVVCEYNRK